MSEKAIELLPELIRFYGGRPEDWLNMSMQDVLLFVQAMKRIKAREKLETIEVLAMGFGLMKPAEQERLRGQWYREAGYLKEDRKRLSMKEREVILASMGVKLIKK